MASQEAINPLITKNLGLKVKSVETACHCILSGIKMEIPVWVGRDVDIVGMNQMPKRAGLALAKGQAQLIHDLASIEMQAVELGLRTLIEFPLAPKDFREQLVSVILDEVRHLTLCNDYLEAQGFSWGSWPVHLSLWASASPQDDLLDRLLIVHRYLEGSGLDASEAILKRLSGVSNSHIKKVVQTIATDEIGHVQFGSRWYQQICKINQIDSTKDFKTRYKRIEKNLPKRLEKINRPLRTKAGFTSQELDFLEKTRTSYFQAKPKAHNTIN